MLYLWIKSFHVISMVAWMAGMFYLPRLFVYHTQTKPGDADYQRFVVMERKLLKYIMNPALIATWTFGLAMLALNPSLLSGQGWMHTKILLVLGMTAAHMMLGKYRREFEENRSARSEKFFRVFNEVPTILLIVIVILVIVKPF
ncbi:protoporphyrinogen oxidase HemJ [Rhodocista pekingensis]|uniref:Protoporphyrinogen IX oxidase n=1 Tax=Rhodocista pekingensis TaxID=201185 RepID=A0ABW2KTC1_9PROT